jgi:hypothetical protein
MFARVGELLLGGSPASSFGQGWLISSDRVLSQKFP